MVECPACGNEFEKGRSFAIHWGKQDSESHPGDPPDKIDTSDPELSEQMEGRELSEAHREAIAESKRGEENPMYGRERSEAFKERMRELKSGQARSRETRKKISESLKGKDHDGQFQSGEENRYWVDGEYDYGPLTQSDKDQIRKAAGHECEVCGKSREEQGYKMSVHHIDGDTDNNEPENLMVICRPCHRRAHQGGL